MGGTCHRSLSCRSLLSPGRSAGRLLPLRTMRTFLELSCPCPPPSKWAEWSLDGAFELPYSTSPSNRGGKMAVGPFGDLGVSLTCHTDLLPPRDLLLPRDSQVLPPVRASSCVAWRQWKGWKEICITLAATQIQRVDQGVTRQPGWSTAYPFGLRDHVGVPKRPLAGGDGRLGHLPQDAAGLQTGEDTKPHCDVSEALHRR